MILSGSINFLIDGNIFSCGNCHEPPFRPSSEENFYFKVFFQSIDPEVDIK